MFIGDSIHEWAKELKDAGDSRADELLAEVVRLREALERYGEHERGCPKLVRTSAALRAALAGTAKCTCGLDKQCE